ncbi:hypothetical protein Asi03nite_46360 [Actinoplanes siamensis]|uniref:Right handed beta helix domain-containing protein n=1 Tax=Actinoplanes siamensis TaxID=1223317 RepID=A0A919NA05_9ACTN|nr:hypothetical protein Asi03nite_46360 [Actinoplanes siamensis]
MAGTVVAMLAAVPPAAATASSSSRTFYVDCAAGSDSAAGTTQKTAWRTLGRASAEVYRPGDSIRLRRSVTCAGDFTPQGSGTAAAPVTLGAYGSGTKPKIVGTGGLAAVHLLNVQGWEVSDLEVTNHGPAPAAQEPRFGILVQLNDFGTGSYYRVRRVDVHDVNGCDCQDRHTAVPSGGVVFWVTGSAVPTTFADVQVAASTVRDVASEGIATESSWQKRAEFPSGPGTAFVPITGLVVKGNEVTHVTGDGIGIFASVDAKVEGNIVRDYGYATSLFRVGIGVGNANGTVLQYNTVTDGNGPNPSQAFAIDHAANRTVVQYNLTQRNNGGALLFCNGAGETAVGNIYRFNVSDDDHPTGSYGFGAPLAVYNIPCPAVGDLSIYGNTAWTAVGTTLVSNFQGATTSFTDNVFVGPAAGAAIVDPYSSYDHNLYHRVSPPAADTTAIVGDPLLAAPGTNSAEGYRLRAGSPALDTGVPVAHAGSRDYFGNKLTVPWNIGADQGAGVTG